MPIHCNTATKADEAMLGNRRGNASIRPALWNAAGRSVGTTAQLVNIFTHHKITIVGFHAAHHHGGNRIDHFDVFERALVGFLLDKVNVTEFRQIASQSPVTETDVRPQGTDDCALAARRFGQLRSGGLCCRRGCLLNGVDAFLIEPTAGQHLALHLRQRITLPGSGFFGFAPITERAARQAAPVVVIAINVGFEYRRSLALPQQFQYRIGCRTNRHRVHAIDTKRRDPKAEAT